MSQDSKTGESVLVAYPFLVLRLDVLGAALLAGIVGPVLVAVGLTYGPGAGYFVGRLALTAVVLGAVASVVSVAAFFWWVRYTWTALFAAVDELSR